MQVAVINIKSNSAGPERPRNECHCMWTIHTYLAISFGSTQSLFGAFCAVKLSK